MKKLSLALLLLAACVALFPTVYKENTSNLDISKDEWPEGPYNLEATVMEVNNVLLGWDNPNYAQNPIGYRVYCNGNFACFVPGSYVSYYLLEDVCGGCHQYYITAFFAGGEESVPSNLATVTITSNDSEILEETGLAMKVWPNPARGDVNIQFSGLKHNPEDISILNVRGQRIRQITPTGSGTALWDGRDSQGRPVGEGIYFLKAQTSRGMLTSKIILVR